MNTDTSTPAGGPEEVARTRLVVAMEWLFEWDDRWRPVPSLGGAMITLTRGWGDATADTVALSPDTTYAVRHDPRGEEIERIRGTAMQVVAAVCDWPMPTRPSTPASPDRVPALSGPRV